jgi:hypothetical protein
LAGLAQGLPFHRLPATGGGAVVKAEISPVACTAGAIAPISEKRKLILCLAP